MTEEQEVERDKKRTGEKMGGREGDECVGLAMPEAVSKSRDYVPSYGNNSVELKYQATGGGTLKPHPEKILRSPRAPKPLGAHRAQIHIL